MYKIKVVADDNFNFTVTNHEFAVISADIMTNAKWILFPLFDSEKEKHPEYANLHTAIKRSDIKVISIELK